MHMNVESDLNPDAKPARPRKECWMEFRMDAGVHTADNEQIGHVERVVLDPRAKEVTHLIIRKGLLFAEDKVMPVEWVASATEERITLRPDVGDLEALPDFEQSRFVTVEKEDYTPTLPSQRYPLPLYYYPTATGEPDTVFDKRHTVEEEEQNIPEGTVALKEGAKVISADGEHVGDVERIFTYPRTDKASHLVVSEGLLLKEQKLVPAHWITELEEEDVHLAVGSQLLDKLPEYEQ
jgi:uncharacterized protein YrrD